MPRVPVPCALALAAQLASAPLLGQAAAPSRAGNPPAASLATELNRLLDAPPFDRALWGVAIADPSGRLVFERNGDRLFVPASNTKIVVAAVAAALLGPDFRFRTSVYSAATPRDGVLHGDLVLYGRGDPTMSVRHYPSALSQLEALADQLRARGITRVAGDLAADASWFDSVVVHPSWEVYDLNWWYAAPVTALGFNGNSVEFRITPGAVGEPPGITVQPDLGVVRLTNRAVTVRADSTRTLDFFRRPGTEEVWAAGSVPVDSRPWTESFAVHDGPAWAGAAFRRALESRGITVAGRVRVVYDSAVSAPARRLPPLAEVSSRPLLEVLRSILESSHNWYAEMLLKTLGREVAGRGTWEAGIEVERSFLVDSLRVNPASFSLADGSGLSHWNLMSPRAFVRVLVAMREHRRGSLLLDALPVGGSTGTLRLRYREPMLAGRVRAKTGTIANVNTLSGYVESPRGPWTFSIQINNHAASSREALRRIDEVVAALAR